MRTLIRIWLICLIHAVTSHVYAQAPQGLNYQSMVNDSSGHAMANHAITARFTIHDGGSAGAIVYRETHTVITNAIGTFSVVIGGGSLILGNFNTINWATGNKYLQVEIDPNAGSAYIDMGTGILLSTAYTLYTGTALQSNSDISGISYDSTGALNLQTGNGTIHNTTPVWTTTGNAGMGNNNNFIGTIDNTDLILKGRNIPGVTIGTGGSLLFTGTAAGLAPVSGAGTRMMWMPSVAAWRAGTVTGNAWDSINTGIGSIGLGTDVLVSGSRAISIGSNNTVTGTNAVAIGNGLIAKTMNVTVMGSYNDTTGSGSATSYNAGDPQFIVGNGSGASARSNAIVVAKNGATTVSGLIVNQAITVLDTAATITSNTTFDPGNHTKANLTVNTGSGFDVTVANGQKVGQIVIFQIHANGGGGHRLNFNDSPTYNMNLNTAATSSNNQYTLKDTDTLTLMWDGTIWVELGHSLNN